MGGRYYITGVQIGQMLAYLELNADHKVRECLDEIYEHQFIGKKKDLKTH